MIEIGIVGAKNSGKTTLVEALVQHFSGRGDLVATVKHSSHTHAFDTPGKDSHRHRQAGAGATMIVSESEMALFGEPTPEQIEVITRVVLGRYDICFVEGDISSSRPKILLTEKIENLKISPKGEIIATYGSEAADGGACHFTMDDTGGLIKTVEEWLAGKAGGGTR